LPHLVYLTAREWCNFVFSHDSTAVLRTSIPRAPWSALYRPPSAPQPFSLCPRFTTPPLWVGDANERRIGTVAQYSAWGSCYVVYVFLLSSILLVVRPLWPCQLQCTITRYVCSCTGTSVISRYRPFELTARRVHGAVVAATSCNALKLVAACFDELTTRCNVARTQPAARLGSLLGEGLLLSACLIFLNLCLLFPFPSLLSLLVAV